MTKPKKTEVPKHETALDQLAAKLRSALKCETTNIIEIGKLLIEARELELVHHGEWKDWLSDNFDMSYRTALRYTDAAKYVESKSATVALFDFENLSPTVLYWLASGRNYNEQEEAAVLAATLKGRVDFNAARAICDALAQEKDTPDADDQEYGGELTPAEDPTEDPEITAILDGPPPEVPPTASIPPPINFALRDFDEAITTLKRLVTKLSTEFALTIHSAEDLEHIEDFIRTVRKALG
jgi:hypothetical protein